MTNRSRSTNLGSRAAAMLLATATVLGGGVLLKAWAPPGPTTSYSTGALVAAAEADMAAGHPGRPFFNTSARASWRRARPRSRRDWSTRGRPPTCRR